MSGITKDQVLSAFRYRRATRSYDPSRKITREDFDYLLELARLSPSSIGSEPWRFLVVQNPELRGRLKPVAWGMATQIDDCSHLVVLLAKKNASWDSAFLREGLARRGLSDDEAARALAVYEKFQKHDMGIAGDPRALFDWCCKQTYIALANMLTGAAMIGIDSCPIEGFDYAEANRILAEAGAFDPQEWGVSVMATFGYRARDIRPRSRKETGEIVQWLE